MGGGGKTHLRELIAQNEAWGKPSPDAIVRTMRKRVALDNIETGDLRSFFNIKLLTTASAIAIGAATNGAR